MNTNTKIRVLTLLMADFKYASKYGFWAALPHTQTVLFEGVEYEERVPYRCSGSHLKCYQEYKSGMHPEYQTETFYKYKIEYATRDGLVILSLAMAFGLFSLFRKNDN